MVLPTIISNDRAPRPLSPVPHLGTGVRRRGMYVWPFAKIVALCTTLCSAIALRTKVRQVCARGGRAQACAQGVHAQGTHKVRTRYAQGTHKDTHKVELNLVQMRCAHKGTTALCRGGGRTGCAQRAHKVCNGNSREHSFLQTAFRLF